MGVRWYLAAWSASVVGAVEAGVVEVGSRAVVVSAFSDCPSDYPLQDNCFRRSSSEESAVSSEVGRSQQCFSCWAVECS